MSESRTLVSLHLSKRYKQCSSNRSVVIQICFFSSIVSHSKIMNKLYSFGKISRSVFVRYHQLLSKATVSYDKAIKITQVGRIKSRC